MTTLFPSDAGIQAVYISSAHDPLQWARKIHFGLLSDLRSATESYTCITPEEIRGRSHDAIGDNTIQSRFMNNDVPLPAGIPDTRKIIITEQCDTRRADRSSKMHGTAIVSNKSLRSLDDCSAFARGEQAT